MIKEKLSCGEHRGNHRWCFVRHDEGHVGKHVQLGLEEVTLWARKIVRGLYLHLLAGFLTLT